MTEPTPAAPGAAAPRRGSAPPTALRVSTLVMLVLLIVQFALGMSVNLFVAIPANHPGAHPANYFGGLVESVGWALSHSPGALASHAGLGLLVVVASFVVLGLAAASPGPGRAGRLTASIVGTLAVIGAGFNGGSFLNYDKDFSSMIMAMLFALAVLCYVALLYQLAAQGATLR